ncbi:hypothetical protein OGAPHI_001123 [Ogataea philodendri]|uniref:Phosphatidic acid phosphatase type 2/haloperoxidase domain-containing protein n=1 Tax=Ogataea philodendri TaxID=1378263 RepID=A0A9P8T8S8_9ASCO|nr:uncharacterized protein OGAPHI_001123 [Ogataea philodendri]KAH3670608.1 hypothetical protein OGAPHI_001123 [Ogataea philodendri]
MFFSQGAEFEFEETFMVVNGHDVSLPTFLSYILDWVFYVVILLSAIFYGVFGTPRTSDFDVRDTSIMHMYVQESKTMVPIWLLIVVAVVVPIIVVVLAGILVTRLPPARRVWDIHCALLALLGACSFQLFTVVILKNVSALPRPDFLTRCVPFTFANQQLGSLSTIGICANPSHRLIFEGLRSFPSGHASTIATTSTVQLLFSAGKLNLFDGRGLSCKAIITVMYPIIITATVSFSRISDNRHFVRDVVAGVFLGTLYGTLFYTIYFPFPFIKENLGRAYLPRRFGVNDLFNGVGGFWKIPDVPGAPTDRTEVPGYYEDSHQKDQAPATGTSPGEQKPPPTRLSLQTTKTATKPRDLTQSSRR